MASRGKKKADDSEESTTTISSSTLVETARGLAEIVSTHNLSELILDTKELTLTVRRGGFAPASSASVAMAPVQHVIQAPPSMLAPTVAAPVDDKSHIVTSPFVGTFYRKPNPDSPNYVSLHDKVDKGAVLCIVEAMKLMNEIEADIAGTIIAILVEDGSPVEYGQALFRIAA